MDPRVSAVILNYNYAEFLVDAIESVLAQDLSRSEMEILVVDDGSTDDSENRVRPYLDRVRWLKLRHGGQVAAFNAAMREARGRFVALLESDDTWHPSKLRRCLERLERESTVVLVQHWLLQTDAHNRPLPGYELPSGPDQFSFEDTSFGRIPYAGTSCQVFRLDRVRPFLPLPEDMLFGADICLRLIAGSLGPIANIPEALGTRRIHERNLFGETLYDDPQKLERVLHFHDAMTRFHRSHRQRMGLPLDPRLFKILELDRHQMEFFLHRYRGELGSAVLSAGRLLRASGARPYTVFKALSLALAFASPRLYLGIHSAYARSNAALRLRRSVFPG